MQEADPTDALAVLGDETRIAILRALAAAEEPLPFSELRRRAGVEDVTETRRVSVGRRESVILVDAGRFNYRLSKLREYFVREEDGGYTLRHAGSRVVAAAGVAGNGSETGELSGAEREEGDECPVCGTEDCERLFHVHLSAPWR